MDLSIARIPRAWLRLPMLIEPLQASVVAMLFEHHLHATEGFTLRAAKLGHLLINVLGINIGEELLHYGDQNYLGRYEEGDRLVSAFFLGGEHTAYNNFPEEPRALQAYHVLIELDHFAPENRRRNEPDNAYYVVVYWDTHAQSWRLPMERTWLAPETLDRNAANEMIVVERHGYYTPPLNDTALLRTVLTMTLDAHAENR